MKRGKEDLGTPESEPQSIVVAGVFIIRETPWGTEVLMAKRLKELEKGRYGPPGGKTYKGETPVQCARRETQEETGIEIQPDTELIPILEGKQIFKRSRRLYTYHGFMVKWIPKVGEPVNREPKKHEDWQWLSLNDLSIHQQLDELSLAAIALLDAYRYHLQTGNIFLKDYSANRLFASSLL